MQNWDKQSGCFQRNTQHEKKKQERKQGEPRVDEFGWIEVFTEKALLKSLMI